MRIMYIRNRGLRRKNPSLSPRKKITKNRKTNLLIGIGALFSIMSFSGICFVMNEMNNYVSQFKVAVNDVRRDIPTVQDLEVLNNLVDLLEPIAQDIPQISENIDMITETMCEMPLFNMTCNKNKLL